MSNMVGFLEPRYITADEALAIHDLSLSRYGGGEGVRDFGLLESALAQPSQSFAGNELYPKLTDKAACLAYGIIRNHPFADGNKRTGAACLATFLLLNGKSFEPPPEELLHAILATADGTLDRKGLAEWVAAQALQT